MTVKGRFFLATAILLHAVVCSCSAQKFTAKAILSQVPVTGFYRIVLSPEMSAHANADLSDIRVATQDSTYVPYIWHNMPAGGQADVFMPFIVRSNSNSGRYSVITVEDTLETGINVLSLVLGNTAVERYTKLSGSDDANNWYIIDDSILFHRSYEHGKGKYIQTIGFPFSKYRYYRLTVDNNASDPLKIIGIGVFKSADTANAATDQLTLLKPSFIQIDSSDHNTYLIIKNREPYITDSFSIDVSAPRFYDRSATAYIMHAEHDSSTIAIPVTGFTISSRKYCSVGIDGQKASVIIIIINNNDNPPLKISSVATISKQRTLVAWLEEGNTYSLFSGNIKAVAPDYDLSHFKDVIPDSLRVLTCSAPVFATSAAPPVVAKTVNYWLWPVIIGAIGILSLLTFRLMKDVNKEQQG